MCYLSAIACWDVDANAKTHPLFHGPSASRDLARRSRGATQRGRGHEGGHDANASVPHVSADNARTAVRTHTAVEVAQRRCTQCLVFLEVRATLLSKAGGTLRWRSNAFV